MTTLCIKRISPEYYQAITRGATVLEQDTTAPKVLQLLDGGFLKLFRRKRWFSSELFYPYVKRFANNASILKEVGIATPEILNLYRFSYNQLDFTAVHYHPLPGDTLRNVLSTADETIKKHFIRLFGELLATLHEHGIYFRSIHLANVLVLPDQQLGLIDFADMKKQSHALSQAKRTRNLKHLQRYQQDTHWLFSEYYDVFLEAYKRVAGAKNALFLKCNNKD